MVGEDKNGNLCSLNDSQILFYNTMFATPEYFTEKEIESSLFFEIIDWED